MASPVLRSLVVVIAVAASSAALVGILGNWGPGPYSYESIRGHVVQIYGRGVYGHMSAEVAIQGIAQDYVTLLAGVPLLLGSYWRARDGGLRSRFLLAGVLGYFLVTYLFCITMGTYNVLFLVYALLLGCSFFALAQVLLSLASLDLASCFDERAPVRAAGGFLMANSLCIGLLWLSVVVPPLLDGSVVPVQTEHYTTLVVQGLDLGLLLPLGFVAGALLVRRRALVPYRAD